MIDVYQGCICGAGGGVGVQPLHEVADPQSYLLKRSGGLTETPLTPLLPMLELDSNGIHCVCVNTECSLHHFTLS